MMRNAQLRRTRLAIPHFGFTLVELLVVIGIIAILIGILFPAFALVRDSANTVKCLSNMRQIGQAQMAYVAQNHDYILPAGYLLVPQQGTGLNAENYATIMVNEGLIPRRASAALAALRIMTRRSSSARGASSM